MKEFLKKLWYRTPNYNYERLRYWFFKRYRIRVNKYWEDWDKEYRRAEEGARKNGIPF